MGRVKEWIVAVFAFVVAIISLGIYKRGKVAGAAERGYQDAVERIDKAEKESDSRSLRDEALKGQR